MRFSLSPIIGIWLVLLAAAVLLALLWIRPRGDRLTSRRRGVLLALRAGSIIVLLSMMLRPAVVHTQVARLDATLIVLADRSRSMLMSDEVGSRSRWDALTAALEQARPTLRELAEELEVKLYTFSGATEAVPLTDEPLDLRAPPDGDETAIGAVLEDVLRREAGKRLAAVVLLSDGAQRSVPPRDVPPQVPARRLDDLGYPLYTVAFGRGRGLGQVRDVAIESLRAPERVFMKNELDAASTLRLDGLVHQNIPVQLLFETKPGEMEVVAATRVQSEQDGQRIATELVYVPELPGEYRVTVRVPRQPGELVVTNNEMSTYVTVLKGGLKVLYLEGTPRIEQKFLRRSLDASPDMQVDFLRIDARERGTRPTDLAERFAPGAYDVYMLGDLDSTAFEPAELEQLAQAVERGAGLIMLGGYHSFGPGGYGGSALAEVLPIEFDRFERQNFDEPIRGDLHLAGPLQMLPTRIGLTQNLMRLDASGEAAWQRLPPLEGANRFVGVAFGANILAATSTGEPLLVAKDYGRGRVLAFAADSTWRWWMSGHEAEHRRFWRQAVLWLARKDESTEDNVWITLDTRRYGRGGRVEFTLGARTPQGEPLPDAQFTAEVLRPDGTTASARVLKQGETHTGLFLETQLPGEYTVRAAAQHDGAELGTAAARFLVFEQDLELDNPAADRSTLESLAAMTRGRLLAPEELPSLLEELRAQSQELEVESETKSTLWDRWPTLLLLVGLLTGEWYLRKRWGLV